MYGCLSVRLDASELSDEMNEYMNTSSTTARVSWNRASREERVDEDLGHGGALPTTRYEVR